MSLEFYELEADETFFEESEFAVGSLVDSSDDLRAVSSINPLLMFSLRKTRRKGEQRVLLHVENSSFNFVVITATYLQVSSGRHMLQVAWLTVLKG